MSRILVLAHGASWDLRYQVSACAASATAVGDRVDLALFFGALDAWARGRWDELDPAPPLSRERLEQVDFPPLSSLVDRARATGLLTLYACSASTKMLGLSLADVQRRVDAIVGWQSFAQRLAEADRTVTF